MGKQKIIDCNHTALPAAMRYILKAENYDWERGKEKNCIV
jgi:hypothetical protein